MTLNYPLVVLIWGLVGIAITSIKPISEIMLHYYERRLRIEKKRQDFLVRQNKELERYIRLRKNGTN